MARSLLLLSFVAHLALGDTSIKSGSTKLGPVVALQCVADAGVSCGRTSATATGTLWCSSASETETGCLIPATQRLAGNKTFTGSVAVSGALVNDGGITTAGMVIADGGFLSAMDFANFPTCNSAREGVQIYDYTNISTRTCSASIWYGTLALTPSYVSAYFPGAPATTNIATTQWKTGGAGNHHQLRNGSMTPLVVGIGAGDAVFTVYNASDAGTDMVCTVPCTSVVGTPVACTGGSALAANVTLQLRLTTNGCSTLPQLNFMAEERNGLAN